MAKQTAEAGTAPEPVEPGDDEGSETAQVVTTDTAVSGYNAVNGVEVGYFDEWYLPIVQTNCGPGGCWDTVIRVANLDASNNAVTIRFFPADDGSGSLQTGFQIQDLVDGGTTWNVNLSDLVPEGWVGTAHVYSDGAVFAMADRYKVGYNMWVTNTGSSADFENLAQVAGAATGAMPCSPRTSCWTTSAGTPASTWPTWSTPTTTSPSSTSTCSATPPRS